MLNQISACQSSTTSIGRGLGLWSKQSLFLNKPNGKSVEQWLLNSSLIEEIRRSAVEVDTFSHYSKGFHTSQVVMSWFFHQHSSYIPWETGWLILDPQKWLSNKPSIDVSYNPRKNTADNQGFGSLLASIKRQLDCNDSVNPTPKQYLTHLTR